MKHYIAILVPQNTGSWRAHVPDFPGCRVDAQSIDSAIRASSTAATCIAQSLQAQGLALPVAQTYEEVRHSDAWATESAIDWSRAVICMVPLQPHAYLIGGQ
jgi:predicted RNase H-like HicB family nuclease